MHPTLLLTLAFGYAHAIDSRYIQSADFHVSIDTATGALLSIIHPNDNASMSWISGPENTSWQPAGSRWGLGYVDLGCLHRAFWGSPNVTVEDGAMSAVYTLDGLEINVERTLDETKQSLEECYTFTNAGDGSLTLNDDGIESFGIYTPFNDHYTSTEDVHESRAHAHIWANGGASAWVKMTRMVLCGPHLGLALTEGALQGYSVGGRNEVTLSNTHGLFLLHPDCSSQFLHVQADKWTAVQGETVTLKISGQGAGDVASKDLDFEAAGNDSYTTSFKAEYLGEQESTLTTRDKTSTVAINVVPDIDNLIAKRVKFITEHQQVPSAYAVYDNGMEGIVTFSTSSDRNTGRERVGMGVLIARWLLENEDHDVEASLRAYYDYVINKLQEEDGYVRSWPIGHSDGSLRLYNWPWVMQLHLLMAKLGNEAVTSHENYTATPTERFVQLVELFYQQDDATEYYPINLPIYESLQFFNKPGTSTVYTRLLQLFSSHGRRIAEIGENYPSSEVNYEQSIVAPATTILLELYRSTNETTWLTAAKGHFDHLLAFSGQQPDYHLHDIAIKHWDGYWFGKNRMWGDTFPHYWSTLTALAMGHYSKATGAKEYAERAEGILRGNLVLFDGEGRGYCAFIYPITVDGRAGGSLDPYANDQDWALAHLLAFRSDE